MSFSDLGLSDELLQAVTDAGYSTPTPIQEQAIPVVLMGRDILGCAQTGTGKTASFTLPMIDILAQGRAKARMPRTLILEPTRELAAQVAENFEVYGKYHKLSMALLIGGTSMAEQIKVIDRGPDVLIATPGRLMDLFDRGRLLLNDVRILVIDEADRMLDMGFIPDVEKIVSLLSPMRQTLFFSATMPPEIKRLADAFLMNPKEITVAPPSTPAKTVTQALVTVQHKDGKRPGGGQKEKRAALRDILKSETVRNALIFCNRKRDIGVLHRSLTKHGYNVGQLHGDMSQPSRMEMLERFKNEEVHLLICSDVAARGLDIPDLSHVFNYDVPTHAEDYVHRIGRTGRAGKEGKAFTIATKEDGKYINEIETLIGLKIPGLDQAKKARPAAEEAMPVKAKPAKEKPVEDKVAEDTAVESAEPEAPVQEPPKEIKEEPKQAKPVAESKPKRQRNRDRDRSAKQPEPEKNRNSGSNVGMGDHTPAFLLRPVKTSS
ncbi:MAG: DEAD/DEAH box helicase [Rhodospirillaceae bacterium]|jgi:superfamily II DNA/RNA helicase|nr:DEAD/DEAH box helicase [Rhodospirillaceae bacterium]MBT7771399.1 DEAD/DEAH box helicase [Rhodospirillales bacterium]MBT4700693.1 DEAD/DEAH box helicase [Rhodospirillaceae bacterium]MBT5032899.1 DEAD/DEAH box helicase [Rhodospirillaceae bacterium]MBT6221416.1 DEAD/DEAH box helicase [Rhodospirillaceae bacterium]